MAKKHLLFSQDNDNVIKWFDKFDKESIKSTIVEHLTQNPNDVLEHCKEYSKSDLRKWAGFEIINFYGVNPETKEISKILTKGNKDYYIKLK